MNTSNSVAIDDFTGIKERSWIAGLLANQAFWVTVAVALICLATAYEEPNTFPTKANLFNVTRNFAGIGIMAMGMTAVIITGGIDLSVGSVMAFVAVVAARLLEAEYPWYLAYVAGLGVGAMVGAVNGSLIAYVKLPPFVVTLGMLSIARSLAIVASDNRVIYQFGPGGPVFKAIGGGQIEIAAIVPGGQARPGGVEKRSQFHRPVSPKPRRQEGRSTHPIAAEATTVRPGIRPSAPAGVNRASPAVEFGLLPLCRWCRRGGKGHYDRPDRSICVHLPPSGL